MINLFLTSSFADVVPLFKSHTNGKSNWKRVTFIPTASIYEEVTFFVDAGRQALLQLGFVVDELEISTASRQEIMEKLQGNDYIYISGGNTFFLLQELRKTGADNILLEQIHLGKPYIGESAGAIILSLNIKYVEDMEDLSKVETDVLPYDGLNVVPFYTLPHYGEVPFVETAQRIHEAYKDKVNLIPISNSQVIFVQGQEIEILSL